MTRWRATALLAPLAWLGLAGGVALVATGTVDRPVDDEPDRPPAPVDRAAEDRLVGRLVDILYPPPATRGGLGPRSVVDGEALAAWMTEVEASRPSSRMRSLYEVVDASYEDLAGRPPASGADGLPGPVWRRFLERWDGWARRHEWPHRLVVALDEVWAPGGPSTVFHLATDDGLGRLAALGDDALEPTASESIDGWTRHVFDDRRSISIRPPLRSTDLFLHLFGSNRETGPIRIAIDGPYHGGPATAYRAAGDAAAGLVLVRWEWTALERTR